MDTGGKIGKNNIDVYMTDRDDAFKFGRRDLEVEILGGN